jgi:hypothetical protein
VEQSLDSPRASLLEQPIRGDATDDLTVVARLHPTSVVQWNEYLKHRPVLVTQTILMGHPSRSPH